MHARGVRHGEEALAVDSDSVHLCTGKWATRNATEPERRAEVLIAYHECLPGGEGETPKSSEKGKTGGRGSQALGRGAASVCPRLVDVRL